MKMTGETENWVCNGVLNDWRLAAVRQAWFFAGSQNHRGMIVANPLSVSASAIVATVRMRRELLRKCRGSRLISAPRPTAAAIPASTARRYPTP